MDFNTCVSGDGRFIVGIHRPEFRVRNLRLQDHIHPIGKIEEGTVVDNTANFPPGDVEEGSADIIFEIHNPFGFRGTTYINSAWADPVAGKPEKLRLPAPKEGSFLKSMDQWCNKKGVGIGNAADLFARLPQPVLVAIAASSSDPDELTVLAQIVCPVLFEDPGDTPSMMGFRKNNAGAPAADIRNHDVFEALVNNPHLPDDYKQIMVLRPGVQGGSEIVGEWIPKDGRSHVFEYLRRNSYIPWGHYAANMANDAVRYRIEDLDISDMTGMRHLYYQRIFVRLAQQLDIPVLQNREGLDAGQLESLRQKISKTIRQRPPGSLGFNASLWGWNFGFQLSQAGYRLHASHQQIHQQNAMIPDRVMDDAGQWMPTFSCGDMVDRFVRAYRQKTGKGFFKNYLNAVYTNTRTDGDQEKESCLVIHEDDHCILFVPKAQVCQWELQLMTRTACGNILEADSRLRESLDKGILMALAALERLGARMVTSIEYSRRFDSDNPDQHLLYSFIPRLPQAPPTFSDAQFRWISGCYPEDVASACRQVLKGDTHDPSRIYL